MQPKEKVFGRQVVMADGETYRIPALNFRQLKELEEEIAKTSTGGNEVMDSMVKIVLPAMQRCYEIDETEIRELLSIECMGDALNAALGTRPRGQVIPMPGKVVPGEATPVAVRN